MFKCHACSSKDSYVKYVNEVFEIGNKSYLVENIPATVCSGCSKEIFSSETSEAIREILYGKSEPIKSVALDVFSYQQEATAS
jgi:YgiT-type zinc finger domain-containing protein